MSMEFCDVSFLYGADSKHPVVALNHVSFTIQKHEYVGLIGHTGSGKSTLVQHMNGLNLPTDGEVRIDGVSTQGAKSVLRQLRQKVGLVFQYPEDQLFEDTIAKDIAFGPKNLGLSKEEITSRVAWSMQAVGLDYETYKEISPFELSGGQKRRVAIAGVLALNPEYLVLDEPTAGLDPQGREEILSQLDQLYLSNPQLTIVLVTHSMEDIARHAQRILVVDRGQLVMDDTAHAVFSRREELEKIGLSVPQITQFMQEYRKRGHAVADCVLTVEEAFDALVQYRQNQGYGGQPHE